MGSCDSISLFQNYVIKQDGVFYLYLLTFVTLWAMDKETVFALENTQDLNDHNSGFLPFKEVVGMLLSSSRNNFL